MDKPWFKAKDYGWGWYPATWQGWLVIALFLVALALNVQWLGSSIGYDRQPNGNEEWFLFAAFLFHSLVLVGGLIWICYVKGEKPEWRWGGKPLKNKKRD